ncbi:hypothetical protein BOX15_Mlig011418g3 [Macrostomum lignano]|uniref:Rho-GAP domain-containing protein n=1 Tax=Macrostomum lignano TaxID=282301 RepID=A0A267DP17_9PLAT|nr:hypothetical protein BOX15_Mlig011418g3 [Macrostomum lignano]
MVAEDSHCASATAATRMPTASSLHQRRLRQRGASSPLSMTPEGGKPLLTVRRKPSTVTAWRERRRRSASAVLFAAAAAVCGSRPSSGPSVTSGTETSAPLRQPSTAMTSSSGSTDSTELSQLISAMNRPATTQLLCDNFETLRSSQPIRFCQLCFVHLSFLIDVPAEAVFEAEIAEEGALHSGGLLGAPDADRADDLLEADALLSLLSARSPVDGVFRKCGAASRQRRLRDSLAEGAGDFTDITDSCSSHDLAGALKASLASLAEPLLTSRLLPYFQRAAAVPAAIDCKESTSTFSGAKMLKAFRLLVQLLPLSRRQFLARLLTEVARLGLAPVTQMSSECLGVLWGPVLLYPRQASDDSRRSMICEARAQAAQFNAAAAFLIKHATEVMQIPETFAKDAQRILHSLRHRRRSGAAADSPNSPPTPPPLSVRFATAPTTSDDFTERQVSMMFAAVRSMPESNRKRQLIRLLSRDDHATAAPVTATPSRRCHVISSPMSSRIDFPMQRLSPDAAD